METPLKSQSNADGIRYASEEARSLLQERLDVLRDPAAAGWEKIKSNASRTVYRGSIGGQVIYLKHFHPRSLVHRIARGVGASDAHRELTFMTYLSGCGVATAPALASMCRCGLEWLATRAVAPCQQGDLWHVGSLEGDAASRRAVRRASLALADMIGRMHAAGVIHRDLHCGNVLVRTDSPGGQLVLTDLHRVRRRSKLSRRARASNLAQLFHDRVDFTTRTDRLRFLKRYLQASNDKGSLRAWQMLIEQFARAHSHRQYAQRQRRVIGLNKYFSPVRLAHGWRGQVVLASKRHMAGSAAAGMEFTAGDWNSALARPHGLFKGPEVEVIKDSPSSLVVRRKLKVGPHEVEVFIKRARRKHPWKFLLDCCRVSRAIRCFRLGHALLTRRVATALPLAALERRVGPFLVDSVLITEAVSGPSLNTFLSTWLARPQGDGQPPRPKADMPFCVVEHRQLAQEVLWQLGRMVQRLHDENFAHRDLKSSNVLVHWAPPQAPEVVLVDLDGLSHWRRLSTRRRFQGVMRLNVSLLNCPSVNHAGRLRMLLGYLRRPGCGRIDFKPYWRVLEEWSAKKLRQQIRSRRKRQKATRKPAS